MSTPTRRMVLLGALAAPALTARAQAQTWPSPSGTIRLIVPFPAGGSTDAVTRQVQPGLQQRLGTTVLVDNQGGGSGALGAARAAKAAPDGNTWLFVFDSHAVNPAMRALPFDSVKDFDPVMLIGTAPNVLAAHPSRPYRTLAEVIAAARSAPLTYATIGAGSLGHLTMVRVARQAGVRLTHVPYRGGGPAVNDAVAGHVDLIAASAALVNSQLQGGTLRPVVQFGAERAPALPEVPTIAESGMAGLESNAWWGVFAPAGVPAPVMERFGRDLAATLRDERVARQLTESQLITIRAGGPEELRAFFAREMEVWGAVVRDNEVKSDPG